MSICLPTITDCDTCRSQMFAYSKGELTQTLTVYILVTVQTNICRSTGVLIRFNANGKVEFA